MGNRFDTNKAAPDVKSSSVAKKAATEVINSSIAKKAAPEVKSSPAMEKAAPDVKSSLVAEKAAPEVKNSPVMKKAALDVKTSPVMKTAASEGNSSVTKKATTEVKNLPKPDAGQVSALYKACRSGDTIGVKKILDDPKDTDINRLEPNGSTALHAASYFGHAAIVTILLQQQDIMQQQKNRHGLTAWDEAANEEIRQIFDQSNGKRFWAI